jgi:hypothetical protein
MLDAMNLEQAIDMMFPSDLKKALKSYNDHSKLQGDACLGISNQMFPFHRIFKFKSIVNTGVIRELSALGCRDQIADYNSVYQESLAGERAWKLFWKFFAIQTVVLSACLGSNWLEGLKFQAMTFFLIWTMILYPENMPPIKDKFVYPLGMTILLGLSLN